MTASENPPSFSRLGPLASLGVRFVHQVDELAAGVNVELLVDALHMDFTVFAETNRRSLMAGIV